MDAPQRRGTDLNLPGLRFIPAGARSVPTERQNPNGVNMDESRNPYNRWFRRISLSHRLSKSDTVECCRLGGLEISVSRAEGWKRGVSDTRRHVAMTEAEFEAFTSGLVEWARGAYDDTAG